MTVPSIIQMANPFKLTNWVLEAMLLKDPSDKNPENEAANRPLVCVTGAGGYLAGHIIKVLMGNGYRVRGTVRNIEDPVKTQHLRNLFPKLELVEADLLKEGSFDAAFVGCKFVVHSASPFVTVVDDPIRDLVDPALKGTINVLQSVLKTPTVKRVVITSSMAAVATEAPPRDPNHRWSEVDWNTDSTLTNGPYRLSKKLAEEAAWQFVHSNQSVRKFELVVLNPSFIIGPPLSGRSDSTSVKLVISFLNGEAQKNGCRPACFGVVDVRDVARAHAIALEIPEAGNRRFILSSEKGVSHLELARMLKDNYSNYPLPSKETAPVAYRPSIDNRNARNVLRMTFTPPQQSMIDMADAVLKQKLVEKS